MNLALVLLTRRAHCYSLLFSIFFSSEVLFSSRLRWRARSQTSSSGCNVSHVKTASNMRLWPSWQLERNYTRGSIEWLKVISWLSSTLIVQSTILIVWNGFVLSISLCSHTWPLAKCFYQILWPCQPWTADNTYWVLRCMSWELLALTAEEPYDQENQLGWDILALA